MFGNNQSPLTAQDWGNLGLMAGLSILANNNGRMNTGQLIAQGGLDALSDLAWRKKYEQEMAQKQAEAEANKWHMDTTNGFMIDKTTGAARPIEGWQAKPTGEMGQYFAMTPEQRAMWDARKALIARAGRTSINNNMGAGYEPSFWKHEGERASKYLGTLEELARNASKKMGDYDALGYLLDGGLETGKFEDAKNKFAQYALGLGINQATLDKFGFQDVATVEAFQNLHAKAVMNALLEQKGVQSERDARRAERTWAELGNTVEGNRWINDYGKALAQREIDRARFIRDEMMKNGHNIFDAERAWEAHLETLPSIVPEMPKVARSTIKNKHGGNTSTSRLRLNPQTGQLEPVTGG